MVQVVNKWMTLKDNCQKLVQNILTSHEIDESSKKILRPQVYNWFKECEKKNPRSKNLRLWNLRSNLSLVSCFHASLLMIGFKGLIYIDIHAPSWPSWVMWRMHAPIFNK